MIIEAIHAVFGTRSWFRYRGEPNVPSQMRIICCNDKPLFVPFAIQRIYKCFLHFVLGYGITMVCKIYSMKVCLTILTEDSFALSKRQLNPKFQTPFKPSNLCHTLALSLPVPHRSGQVLDRSPAPPLPVRVPAERERVRGRSGQSGLQRGPAALRDRAAVRHARDPRRQTEGRAPLVPLWPLEPLLLRCRVLCGAHMMAPFDGSLRWLDGAIEVFCTLGVA